MLGCPRACSRSCLPGREVGEYLVTHPGVDKISFTGSSAAGKRIGGLCGERLKRCTLELGGKSAAIILDDADLGVIMPNLFPNTMMNNGQACIAQTRILAPRARYDEVVDSWSSRCRPRWWGTPWTPRPTVGPLVAERQRDRVEGYLRSGQEEGAASPSAAAVRPASRRASTSSRRSSSTSTTR